MNHIDYLKENYIYNIEDIAGKSIVKVYNSGDYIIFTDEGKWTVISVGYGYDDSYVCVCKSNEVLANLLTYNQTFISYLEEYTNFDYEHYLNLKN